jgi:hypothetical protein
MLHEEKKSYESIVCLYANYDPSNGEHKWQIYEDYLQLLSEHIFYIKFVTLRYMLPTELRKFEKATFPLKTFQLHIRRKLSAEILFDRKDGGPTVEVDEPEILNLQLSNDPIVLGWPGSHLGMTLEKRGLSAGVFFGIRIHFHELAREC